MIKNGRVAGHGTPIPRTQQPDEQGVIERPTRGWNFADFLDFGKDKHYSHGMNLPPAPATELNRIRLEKCVAAGMTKKEIADKFSCTYGTVEGRCAMWGIRKRKNSKTSDQGADQDILAWAVRQTAEQEPAAIPASAEIIPEPVEPIPADNEIIVNPDPAALEAFFADGGSGNQEDERADKRLVDEILEHLTVPVIKDSGQRTEFSTGAVRDLHEGKGRYDLLPWNAIHAIAVHCECGALKYGERNVDQGIPTHSLADSATRHMSCYYRGINDEPHTISAAWNLLWLIEMELTRPDLQDIPARQRLFPTVSTLEGHAKES